MAIWPFNRRKQAEEDYADGMQEELPIAPEQQQPTSNLPEEVQEYYESGKRERVGVAWLLGLGTLVVTVVLAMGLFFGGRWLYRTIAGTDEPENTAQIGEDQQKEQPQNQQNSDNQNQGQTQQPSQPQPAPQPQPQPAPAPTPQPAPAPAPQSAPTPAPAPVAGKTPNTGPGDVAAIAGVVTAVASTAGAYVFQLRREN